MSALPRVADATRLRRLVDAVLTISADLSLPDALRHIVQAAVEIVDARYGALGVLSPGGEVLDEFIAVGMTAGEVAAVGSRPEGRGLLGLLVVEPGPLRLRRLSDHPDSSGFPEGHPPMTSFLGVPIRVRDRVYGNLYVTDKQQVEEFSPDDEALVVALAGAAGIAVENARLHQRVRDLVVMEDRERIAADLHDNVIQRLFATGLGLQATARLVQDGEVARRLGSALDDLETTVRQIRTTIFALAPPRMVGRTVREEILSLATEAAASLGFHPQLRLDGDLDSELTEEIVAQVLAVLREGLSNIVRHADATAVHLRVHVGADAAVVEVTDDGGGLQSDVRPGGYGLHNLARRAETLGGALVVGSGADGRGTQLTWRVPLRRDLSEGAAAPLGQPGGVGDGFGPSSHPELGEEL